MLIWVRAKDWVKEESISEDLYLRLSKSAELYQLGNTGLWTNPDLDLALKWYQQNKPNKTWAFRYDPAYARAISFLDYSKSEFDKEIKHKENAQKRKLAFTRNFAIFLGAASIISILFLIIALNLRFKAEESEKKALEKEKLAIVESRKADEKSREAITHKKIAEQQQIIAEQQRIISEEQKKYAITQQEIAIVERNQADVAKNEAQVRRQQAEVSMNVAKKEKSKADSLRIIAFNEKEISERLRMLAIAKSLAIKSVDLFKTQRENTDIQKLLALHSFAINTKNKGSLYDPDIFTALSYASTQNKLFIGHKSKVRSLSFKDNENFISVSDDGIVKIWNKEKSVAEKSINTYSEPRSIAYASDKQILYVGCFDGKLLSVNLTNEKSPIIVLLKTGNSINAASYNNGFIAIGDSKGILTYWDSNLMLNDTNRINLNSKINSIVFSPDGEKFAVGCENGLIRIFFTNKYKVAYDLQKQGDAITALAFNSTNQELASTSVKNDIKIWNITTLFSTFVNIRHASRINAICFNPVDKLIASCSYDGTIKIVNYEKNDNDPVIIADQNDWVLDLKFSQDGAYLISAGNDKTVRLYGTNMSILAEKIKISRDFSASEWVKYAGLNVPFEPLNK